MFWDLVLASVWKVLLNSALRCFQGIIFRITITLFIGLQFSRLLQSKAKTENAVSVMKRFTFKHGLTPNLIIAAKFEHYRLNCQDSSCDSSPSPLVAVSDAYKVTHATARTWDPFQKVEMQSQRYLNSLAVFYDLVLLLSLWFCYKIKNCLATSLF